MTRQKSFKTRVRARAEKTGERYTTARRHLLARSAEPAEPVAASPAPAGKEGPRRPSDDAVRRSTGRPYEEWFELLDRWGAGERSHKEIAAWLDAEHGTGGWWAQSVTVAYEQARGRRAPGQRSDGFEISASATVAMPVDDLYAAFADETLRRRWLPDAPLTIRTTQPGRSMRANWGDGSSRVNVYFAAKGDTKSHVAVVHERLADAAAAEEQKTYWRARLKELKALQARPAGTAVDG